MRRMGWIVVTGAAAIAVLSSAFGYAAAQGTGTNSLGSNTATVSRCDTDGITVTHNLSGSNVISVAVGSIASACGNASISVDVNNGTANSSGSGTVPAGGGSMTVTLGAGVAAKDGMETDVAISGP